MLHRVRLLVLTTFVVVFCLKSAAAEGTHARLMQAPPLVIRKSYSKMTTFGGAVQVGKVYLVWSSLSQPSSGQGNWTLTTWVQERGQWHRTRITRLSAGDEPAWWYLLNKDHYLLDVKWLLPRRKQGPILDIQHSMYYNSFYVFPQGWSGPVIVFTGGSGDAGWNCSYYRLGGPDTRGYRVLKGTYQFEYASTKDIDRMERDVTTWTRYWTKNGWTRKGPEKETTE